MTMIKTDYNKQVLFKLPLKLLQNFFFDLHTAVYILSGF